MKKIFTFFLALIMMMSLSITAFAAEQQQPESGTFENTKGSIVINGAHEDTVYEIYRLLNLKSFNTAGEGAYSYVVNPDWRSFFDLEDTKQYYTEDASGYVKWTWLAPADGKVTEAEAVANFAKAALAYAKANNISPIWSSENENPEITEENPKPLGFTMDGGIGTFRNLDLGYYLVDSSMGALCGLTTTNPKAVVNAKNISPTLVKQVQEDSTSQWDVKNSADIGQIVEYRVTINVHAGAENYRLHDKMEESLTFEQSAAPNAGSATQSYRGVWRIEHVTYDESGASKTTPLPREYYTVITNKLSSGYTPVAGDSVNETGYVLSDSNCDFEIQFSKAFCNHLKTNDKIVVHYNAMLNRNADIEKEVDDTTTDKPGNENIAWLTFGQTGKTKESVVETYTYKFDLVKTDTQNGLLDGAEFLIYDALTGGNLVGVVPLKDSNEQPVKDAKGNPMYRRARADETGVSIVVKDGMVTLVGFDNGTYYLEETKEPKGYNKLSARHKFIISDANLNAEFVDNIYSSGSGVQVSNATGSMLPETGGAGKAMFITFGMIAALGTGVILVTRKRMNMIK